MLIFLLLAFISFRQTSLSPKLSSSTTDSSFQILDVLGSGTYGVVLKVRLRSTNQSYAMKVPHPTATSFSRELKVLQCLENLTDSRQQRSFALLSSEIHQPFVFDFRASLLPDRCLQVSTNPTVSFRAKRFFQSLMQYFKPPKPKGYSASLKLWAQILPRGPIKAMVFPLYRGGDLRMLLKQVENDERELTDSSIINLAIGIVRALQHLHNIHYVHQDLKPANILLDSSNPLPDSDIGRPVLADFGLTVQSGEFLKRAMGTRGYMGPEKNERHHVDVVEDIFSLGSVFKQLVSRRNLSPRHLFILRNRMPKSAPKDIISRCWSTNITVRPSLNEIKTRLEELREKKLSKSIFFLAAPQYCF